uniref:Zinc finger, CCHC-type n=1 Tax=Tanacetum cinerariifolium TaxID=118510 RepID=A0A699I5F9_TANCI|nr:zinc finger, CCHC-type [Tanacetum cinerariifolium]
MVKMVSYEVFACPCGAGDVVLRESYKPKTRGSSSTPIYSPRSSTPPRYSPGASTPQTYSPGTSRNEECLNCKHLLDKITVSNDDTAMVQRRLEDKQPKEKTKMDCLVKEQEKVHLGIKLGENITVSGVPSQEGAEGNVAKKKKVRESMKDNLRKLLKYKAWLTRRPPVRGSSIG